MWQYDIYLKEYFEQKEPDANLRVFPDGKLPADALTRDQLVDSLKQSRRRQIQAAMPVDSTSLKNFRTLMTPAWAHTLQLEWPAQPTMPKLLDQRATDGLINCRLVVASESGHELEAAYWAPQYDHLRRAPAIVVLASPKHPTEKSTDHPSATAAKWLANGMPVVEYDLEAEPGTREQFSNFYTTYNRTTLQRRVASLVALCNAARFSDAKKSGPLKVILCAEGLPALYATLAAPAADAVIADCSGLSFADETSLLAPDYFCPGFLAMGGDVTPLILAAPHPLLLHNASDAFDAGPIRAAYGEAGKSKLRIDRNRLDDEALVQWARTIKYN